MDLFSVLASLSQCIMVLLIEGFEITAVQSVADLSHKLVIEVEVMLYCKAHTDGLLRFNKVANIGTAVVAAGGATAIFVDGTGIAGIFFVHNIDLAVPGEHVSVAGITGGHYTVKEVNA